MFWTRTERKGLNAMLKAILPQTSLLQLIIGRTMGDFGRFSHQITQTIITSYGAKIKFECLGIFYWFKEASTIHLRYSILRSLLLIYSSGQKHNIQWTCNIDYSSHRKQPNEKSCVHLLNVSNHRNGILIKCCWTVQSRFSANEVHLLQLEQRKLNLLLFTLGDWDLHPSPPRVGNDWPCLSQIFCLVCLHQRCCW